MKHDMVKEVFKAWNEAFILVHLSSRLSEAERNTAILKLFEQLVDKATDARSEIWDMEARLPTP